MFRCFISLRLNYFTSLTLLGLMFLSLVKSGNYPWSYFEIERERKHRGLMEEYNMIMNDILFIIRMKSLKES